MKSSEATADSIVRDDGWKAVRDESKSMNMRYEEMSRLNVWAHFIRWGLACYGENLISPPSEMAW